jgi:hypothetical protein
MAANLGMVDHPGRRGGLPILKCQALLQVRERSVKVAYKKGPPSESYLRFAQERLVVVALRQSQESLPEFLCRLVRRLDHIKQPQPGEHWQQLSGVLNPLTERIRLAIGLFHLRSSLTLGSHQRSTQGYMHV